MITYKKQMIEQRIKESITCDICKKTYHYESKDGKDDWIEVQEFYRVWFKGGYGSVFGDSVAMQAHICQHCMKKVLGEYLVVDEDNCG